MNLLIVGCIMGGKSTLSNILCDTGDFRENGYTINETENLQNLQKKDFEWNGMKYHVVETGIGSIEKKAIYNEITNLIPEGISQILFVVDRSFTTGEKIMLELYKEIIFEAGILEYVTILVRNKFNNIRNKTECEGDKKYVFEENEIIAEIVNSCNGIIHVDHPSIDIDKKDDDYGSRNILLNYLEGVYQEKYYKLNKWDDLHSKIISYYTKSDKNLYKKRDQKWFNEKCSKEKVIDITDNRCLDFTNSLKIEDFKNLESISLKKLQLTSLEISNCSQLNKINLSELIKLQNLSVTECSNLTTLNYLPTELTNLKISYCSQLNEVDLSKFTKLEIVSIAKCPNLIMLDFCSLIELTNLKIRGCSQLNQITRFSKLPKLISLFVINCPKITKLDCSNSKLAELEVSGLIELNCSNTSIEELSLKLCPNITKLNCSNNNKLVELDASNCSNLEFLDCSNNNKLIELNVNNCFNLEFLDCSNSKLTSLDLSNCSKLKDVIKPPNLDIAQFKNNHTDIKEVHSDPNLTSKYNIIIITTIFINNLYMFLILIITILIF
jgi:hypothetical protein